jgi:molybdopterin-guanine dinucleotide biosynthesis protein A
MIHRDESVTGLVLAGGRGSRMGGVDKGLQTLEGKTLVEHALARLAPQVGALMINANRHFAVYAGFGVPVWPDANAEYAGPLAGFLAGLAHCETEWLVSVPCDSPRFPLDLVARLAAARGDALVTVSVTEEDGLVQRQPVFCMMHRTLHDDLADYLAGGGRKIDRWLDRVGCAEVYFEDARAAFFNANTIDELRRLGAAD